MTNASHAGKTFQSDKAIIAFEVSKSSLVVHVLPANTQARIANTAAAIRQLMARHDPGKPHLVVCEATGGYERHVLEVCHAGGFDIHRAHGSMTRAFARYRGLAAKTDAIDARMLAEYGRDTPDLRLHRQPEPEDDALRSLRKRRDEIVTMLRMETNRLEHAHNGLVRKSVTAHIKMLEKQRKTLEEAIAALIKTTPVLKHKVQLITSIKGVGPMTAQACLAYLPELGTLSKGEAAALVGLAPRARDSGQYRGARHIGGGRKAARSSLYMAAVVAITYNPHFKAFAQKLKERGKPAKVVITAVMRRIIVIINAVIKSDEPCKQA